MNEELIVKVKKALQDIFSTACDQPLIICAGSCSPLFIQGIKQNIQSHQQVLVIDSHDNFETFRINCKTILENAQELRYRIILENAQEYSLTDRIKKNVSAIIKDITGKRYRTELQFYNFFMNIPALCLGEGISKLKGIAQGKTIAVLGAGPSLKETVPWIKENRQKIFIIAAGSIASGLFKNDVHPDLYVETDHRAPTHWEDIDPSKYSLVAATTITAGLASRFKQVFWLEGNSPHRDWIYEWEKRFCPNIDRVKSPDQNTGLTALGVAEYCGASSILLIGIDLCLSPEGDSHSDFFHRGKDKVQVSPNLQTVKNNEGENCPTIYGTFINGFNEFMSKCPETTFFQTSESGVKFDNAVFKKVEDCILPEAKCELEISDRPFQFQNFRPIFRELQKQIKSFNGKPETELQQQFLNIIKINSSVLGISADEEYNRQKERYLNSLAQFQSTLHELQALTSPIKELIKHTHPEVSEVGVSINWHKEYLIAGLPLDLDIQISKIWKLDWQRTHMMQLLIRSNENWKAVSGQYEITEKAAELVNFCLKKHQGPISRILCLGVWDGNYLMLLASKFSHCQFIVVEPDTSLLGKMLRYVPLASKLPQNTKWCKSLSEVNETEIKESLVICPDEKGEFFPELGQMFSKLKNL